MTNEHTRRAGRVIPAALAGLMALAVAGVATAADSYILSATKYTNGAHVRRAFMEAVTEANEWTVRIETDEEIVAYGAVVHPDGYVLTKASQLQGELLVRLADGRTLPADYVGYSPDHDVALLKVAAEGIPAVQWQEQDDPHIGAWVMTPDQQGAPRSVGVISLERRKVPRVRQPAILGIRMIRDVSQVIVQQVYPDSAAERAGLQEGDVIDQVDQTPIDSPRKMAETIAGHSPGDTVTLRVRRDGETLQLRASLTHPFGEFQSRIAMQNQLGGALSDRRNGFPVVIQHDSVLQPDECGGPLVDLSGRAVGINIARAGRTESYAIPDDVLVPLIAELMTGKSPPPAEQDPTLAKDIAEEQVSQTPQRETSEE